MYRNTSSHICLFIKQAHKFLSPESQHFIVHQPSKAYEANPLKLIQQTIGPITTSKRYEGL